MKELSELRDAGQAEIEIADLVCDLEHAVLDRASVMAMGRVASVEQFAVEKARLAIFAAFEQAQKDMANARREIERLRDEYRRREQETEWDERYANQCAANAFEDALSYLPASPLSGTTE